MRVEVRPIYVRGVALRTRDRDKLPPAIGDLRVIEDRMHKLGRIVLCARLTRVTDGMAQPLLPDIVDARLLYVTESAMRLQGTEELDGVLYAQTWDIKVL